MAVYLNRLMKVFLTILFSILSLYAPCQDIIGFKLPDNRKSVTIPFRFINNLIVIPVTINNNITLEFILDSGASTPILTEKVFGDLIGLSYDRTIELSGPGVQDSIMAFVANDLEFSLADGIHGKNLSLLVLQEDYIDLKKNLGEDIFGIIGYDVFSRFIVKLDYDEQEITLIHPENFRKPRNYEIIPMDVDNTKPYINTIVKQNGNTDTLKMMVDTGASHGLLLDVHMSDVLTYPDSTINTTLGHGLGGEIPGEVGRFSLLQIDQFELNNILVSIPEEGAYGSAIKRGSRNGTIGGNVLSHFTVIMDYYSETMYLKEGNDFNEPFEYDMSGMRLSYLENPKRMEVTYINSDSPAEEAGLKVGMLVKSVNHKSLKNSSLSSIYQLLREKPEKKIRVKVIDDEGQSEVYKFRLRRLI
jgi:hypothetical protein